MEGDGSLAARRRLLAAPLLGRAGFKRSDLSQRPFALSLLKGCFPLVGLCQLRRLSVTVNDGFERLRASAETTPLCGDCQCWHDAGFSFIPLSCATP